MGLDRETELRLRALFAGQVCCECGKPAGRLANKRYYCHWHFAVAKRAKKPVQAPPEADDDFTTQPGEGPPDQEQTRPCA